MAICYHYLVNKTQNNGLTTIVIHKYKQFIDIQSKRIEDDHLQILSRVQKCYLMQQYIFITKLNLYKTRGL